MEFLFSLLKGIYPYFTVPAIIVMLYCARKRQWKKEYSLLICLFLIGVLAVIMQIIIADGILFISRRYLLPFAPVLFGFTAWGICRLQEGVFKKGIRIFIFVLFIFLCIDSMMPVLKDYTSRKRRTKNHDIDHMAMVIKQQSGPAERISRPVWWYEPRIGGNIVLKDAPAQLVWQVRGMAWSPYFPHERVDYLVAPADSDVSSKDHILLYKGGIYSLYKNKEKKDE